MVGWRHNCIDAPDIQGKPVQIRRWPATVSRCAASRSTWRARAP